MRRVISFTFFNLITTDVVCVTKMEVLQMRWDSLFQTHKNCFNKLKKTNSYESVFSPALEIKVWVGALVGVESCTNMEKYKTAKNHSHREKAKPLHEHVILHVFKLFGPFSFITLCVIAYF